MADEARAQQEGDEQGEAIGLEDPHPPEDEQHTQKGAQHQAGPVHGGEDLEHAAVTLAEAPVEI